MLGEWNYPDFEMAGAKAKLIRITKLKEVGVFEALYAYVQY